MFSPLLLVEMTIPILTTVNTMASNDNPAREHPILLKLTVSCGFSAAPTERT